MKIGRYEILELIGQGAVGKVYKALDPLIERTVAIKTVPISRLKEEGSEFEARFLREAQSAGRLSHPNIVTIYDVGEADDFAYIAMEYLRGTTLRDVMDIGPMPLDLVMSTAQQVAEALAYAHDHGVVHRDIKPSNIVITLPHGQVKLTDFGIAHLVNSDRTYAGLMLGSPRYMSPEQAMGRDINGCSDIFSLGAVLYEMVTGEYAFDGDSLPTILYRVINILPPPPVQLRPETTPLLDGLIMRMLSKQSDARMDAQGLLRELNSSEALVPFINPYLQPETRVPRLLAIMAFSTPFVVLLTTGIGMIVINYFLAMAPTITHPSRAVPPPLLSTPNNAILDWTAQTESPTVLLPGPSQQNTLPAQPNFSPTLKNIQLNPDSKPAAPKPAADPYLRGLEKKKVEYEIKRTELLLKYTVHHPDVMLVQRQLKQLEIKRKQYLRKNKSGTS
ncbi:MAG: serine/threonine-protein kinase [Thiobacillus sp.]